MIFFQPWLTVMYAGVLIIDVSVIKKYGDAGNNIVSTTYLNRFIFGYIFRINFQLTGILKSVSDYRLGLRLDWNLITQSKGNFISLGLGPRL